MKVLHVDVDGHAIVLLNGDDQECLGYRHATLKAGESYQLPNLVEVEGRARYLHRTLGEALEGKSK